MNAYMRMRTHTQAMHMHTYGMHGHAYAARVPKTI